MSTIYVLRSLGTLAVSLLACLLVCATAQAAPVSGPFQLMPANHIGWEVNKTTGGTSCPVASKDECQARRQSSRPIGFIYPTSVAANWSTGNVYVADEDNDRVQELTANGKFVLMFGWGVNETKNQDPHASQQERNLCTAASGDVCVQGAEGTAAEQISIPNSVTVDQKTGDVYVLEAEKGDYRVDKFTGDGRFLWMVGRHVNATTKGNLCTAAEMRAGKARCQGGEESPLESSEAGAFKYTVQYGNLLAAGGPEDLLYVGDEHRLQIFYPGGRFKTEIPLNSFGAQPYSGVVGVAVDPAGDVYLVYRIGGFETGSSSEHANVIHVFNANGEQVREFTAQAVRAHQLTGLNGISLDGAGRLAVIGVEGESELAIRFGALYDALTGQAISEWPAPLDNDGIGFDRNDVLFVAATDDQELTVYEPVAMPQLVSSPVDCQGGGAGGFYCTLVERAVAENLSVR